MRDYRRAWRTWWLLFALVGTAGAVLTWPAPVLLLTWIFGATLGAALITGSRGEDDAAAPFAHVTAREALSAAVSGALVMSGVVGWLAISAVGGIGLVALALVSSPWFLGVVRSRTGASGPPVRRPGETLDDVIADAESLDELCHRMSTPELCLAWHQTFTLVNHADAPHRQMRVLVLREAFLDELVRRDPDGLDAWICSPVPAHAAPTAFFGGRPDLSS
jgi:hypothetical protein